LARPSAGRWQLLRDDLSGLAAEFHVPPEGRGRVPAAGWNGFKLKPDTRWRESLFQQDKQDLQDAVEHRFRLCKRAQKAQKF